LFAGLIFMAMMLTGTLLTRLPLSGAMVYLGLGYLLGPDGASLIMLDPAQDADLLGLLTEVALLISLFASGLKLEVPLFDRRWIVPLRLATTSMCVTVGLMTLVGVVALRLPLGAAILLGATLAPTDPVLASAIQSPPGPTPDPIRFSLAGEGALNDGTALPFVLLGLGLMGLYDLGAGGWHWWALDLLWSTLGGVLIGLAVGALIGNLVIFLRTRHYNAIGLDEFLSLGVIAISFGLAQSCLASGFLSVFCAGLALRRVRDYPAASTVPLTSGVRRDTHTDTLATHSHHASGAMTRAVQGFNDQLERLAELGIVMVTGAMLHAVQLSEAVLWLTLALILIVRPLSVLVGLARSTTPVCHRFLIGWMGIRGIGSVYYLMFALQHELDRQFARQMESVVLVTVATSIVAHGISMRPLMKRYTQASARTR
jgi:sodium/hydrogen antiporter